MTQQAAPHACSACPWRLSNQGKRHPDGWYSKANLSRLWSGLRRGEAMSCHPSDPNNEVSEKAQALGYQQAAPDSTPRECTGALTLQQREIMRLQVAGDMKAYRAVSPRGLTVAGVRWVAERVMFGGSVWTERMAKPNLNDREIGYEPLVWDDEIAEACRSL